MNKTIADQLNAKSINFFVISSQSTK